MKHKLIKKYCKNKNALDVGSGSINNIALFNFIKKQAKSCKGIDKLPTIESDIVFINIEDYYTHKKFDVITAFGVFHQIFNIGKALENIYNALKPKGFLIVGVPYVFAMKYRVFGNRLEDSNAIRWYCKKTLIQLLEKYCFNVIDIFIYRQIKNPELVVVARK